jgi:hypothetical protein
MKVYPFLGLLLCLAQLLAAGRSRSQAQSTKVALARSYCASSKDEVEVYRDQLRRDTSPKSTAVVMATTNGKWAFYLAIAAAECSEGLWSACICALYAQAHFSNSFGRVGLRRLDAGTNRGAQHNWHLNPLCPPFRGRGPVRYIGDGQESSSANRAEGAAPIVDDFRGHCSGFCSEYRLR